ncbi:MAG: methionyl-tRNA formyltransferase [Terriglobia bacterium]
MNIIFCGTPQFAVPSLERLLAENFTISLVITNPDEPRGRGYKLALSPVKAAALRAGLSIFQPARLRDPAAQTKISAERPDAIVVVAYGHLIPPWMISLPALGCINLHASLLPRYRGAAPVAWAIIRGERTTGVTTMKIDAGLDTGDILLQQETSIRADDTAGTLSDRLSQAGASLMVETLRGLELVEIQPRQQDDRLATLAPVLKKSDGRIDWNMTAREIGCRVRGMQPWPVAFTSFRNRNLQLWSVRTAEVLAEPIPLIAPGEIVAIRGRLFAGCGAGTQLELLELQAEGRKRVPARDFVNGMHPRQGERLGA